jgi:predicted nucleotidyltransferase component of viral defense system
MNEGPHSDSFILHHDHDLFRASVAFTAGHTRFLPRLIEKDYFSSILLGYLRESNAGHLIFKGGTCLAKVHADFYRLSEDLDFVIPTPVDSRKGERSKLAAPLKKALMDLPAKHSIFAIEQPLTGHNESRQYLATIVYGSLLDRQPGRINLEIGLREPLFAATTVGEVRTLLRNAAVPDDAQPSFYFLCLSFEEAMAEKFRAALTRREVAIRDFFDIDYMVQNKRLNPETMEFISLVRKKVEIPGNDPPDFSDDRHALLTDQLNARLKPMLRVDEFNRFDLRRAITTVKRLGQQLSIS